MSLILFVLGLVMGSFFNVVGIRLPVGESVVSPPSKCTKCNRRIKPYELVPIISYLFLRGKCRGCHKRISVLYPLIELITGVLFLIGFYVFGLSVAYGTYLIIASLLIVLTVSDIHYTLVPNRLLVMASVMLFIWFICTNQLAWGFRGLGVLTALAVSICIILAYKGKGMGGGDIKLFLVLGYVLGWKLFIVTFFVSAYVGLIYGGIYWLKTKERKFPFVPSIGISVLLVMVTSKWWVNLFF